MSEYIKEIDRIRKIEVPWKIYLAIFVVVSFLTIVAAVLLAVYVRMNQGYLFMSIGIFIAVLFIVMATATFCQLRDEEVKDSKILAKLFNAKKEEVEHQINQRRMYFRLNHLCSSRTQAEIDNDTARKCNLVRLQSLNFMESLNQAENFEAQIYAIDVCLCEVLFNSALLLKRVYLQSYTLDDLVGADEDCKLDMVR